MTELKNVEKKSGNGFASRFGFIMAAAGSAVGLGNLWGFPGKTATGGGAAWVFVYLLCVLLIGVVVMVAEMFIGQRAQKNAVDAYRETGKRKAWGWVGLFGVVVAFVISTYYVVIGGWSLKFTFNSFNTAVGNGAPNFFANFVSSGLDPIFYTAIFFAVTVAVICAGVEKGIEKVSKVMMPALFVLLIIVMIKSLTLGDGVAEGLAFYLKPDFSKLTWTAILSAMGQAFFSLSLGMGAMVAYGSYTKKTTNLGSSALMVCGLDTLVAFMAGLAIFPAVFAFGLQDKAIKGTGLMFQTLPQVFASMGAVGSVFSFLFFGLVVLAALTSIISLLEVVSQYLIERTRFTRKQVTLVASAVIMVIACVVSVSVGDAYSGAEKPIAIFGVNLLDVFDTITNVIMMPIAALFACLVVGWVIKPKNAIEEMRGFGYHFKWDKVWGVMVKFVTPIFISVILVMGVIELFEGKNPNVADAGTKVAITAIVFMALIVGTYFLVSYLSSKKKTPPPTETVEK